MNDSFSTIIKDYSIRWSDAFPKLQPLPNYCNLILSTKLKKPVFDIVKFDKEMQWRFQYDHRDISLSDFVKEHYGEKAHQLIKDLIK